MPAPDPTRLPITDPSPSRQPLSPTITAATISAIVDDFYTRCRADSTLGPIFNAQVHDWPAHLARIRDFWSAAILRSGQYAGRPLEAHLAIPTLRTEHFSIWLRLFRQTVETHCSPTDAATFMTLAGRMANRIIAASSGRDDTPSA